MGPGCKIFALKRIKLAGRDEEAASGFIDEINLLKCLRNKPNIIQLVDSQVGHGNVADLTQSREPSQGSKARRLSPARLHTSVVALHR